MTQGVTELSQSQSLLSGNILNHFFQSLTSPMLTSQLLAQFTEFRSRVDIQECYTEKSLEARTASGFMKKSRACTHRLRSALDRVGLGPVILGQQ